MIHNLYFYIFNSSSEYDESMCDLLSALHSASGLKKVDLFFRFMTVDGVSRVLDLIQMNPSLSKLRWEFSSLLFIRVHTDGCLQTLREGSYLVMVTYAL